MRVPAAGVAVSPSSYVVDDEVWIVRWKPWKSVIVIVFPDAETTVPARNGVRCRGPRSGAVEEPGDGGEADGLADGAAESEVAAAATATPPTASAAAATPATASRRPVRHAGPDRLPAGGGPAGGCTQAGGPAGDPVDGDPAGGCAQVGGGDQDGPGICSGGSSFTSTTMPGDAEDRLKFSSFTGTRLTLRSVTAARVLVVEDEPVLREAFAAALEAAGFVVLAAADGRELPAAAARFRPDAAVLDISLPGPDGLALARRLRELGEVAVVFVTARDAVSDRLAGFAAGADDYLVKPFVLAELVARLRAVLRRTGRLVSPTVEIGELVLDEDAGRVLVAGEPVPLTATELRLLAYLVRNRGRVLSKTQILTQVWGYDEYDPNLVEAHVSALRRKLEARGPRVVHTVRGVGYRVGVSP
jgi:two-component system, OmpR family, response regulator